MPTSLETLQSQMVEVDAETTRIADEFQALLTQAVEGTITIDQLNTEVQPRLDALRLIGNPVDPNG